MKERYKGNKIVTVYVLEEGPKKGYYGVRIYNNLEERIKDLKQNEERPRVVEEYGGVNELFLRQKYDWALDENCKQPVEIEERKKREKETRKSQLEFTLYGRKEPNYPTCYSDKEFDRAYAKNLENYGNCGGP